MKPILYNLSKARISSYAYTAALLLAPVILLLGMNRASELVDLSLSANNIPNNQVLAVGDAQVNIAGVQKVILPPKSLGFPPPFFSASAALVKDLDSDTLLFVKDPDKRLPIASTTKIMTALVAAGHFKPNDVLTVTADSLVNGSTMGLKVGEQITFRSLLYGMLLNSGNDAAYTIAVNFPGGVTAFIEAMNKYAQSLGLVNTHFDNPAGFDSPNHYSSASDLARIASLVPNDGQLQRVVDTRETTVASVDKSVIHPLRNLNKLLNLPGVMGIKTGTTPQARENLVGLVERDGHKILTVVLGSDDRFGDTQDLIDWTYTNFNW